MTEKYYEGALPPYNPLKRQKYKKTKEKGQK